MQCLLTFGTEPIKHQLFIKKISSLSVTRIFEWSGTKFKLIRLGIILMWLDSSNSNVQFLWVSGLNPKITSSHKNSTERPVTWPNSKELTHWLFKNIILNWLESHRQKQCLQHDTLTPGHRVAKLPASALLETSHLYLTHCRNSMGRAVRAEGRNF